MRIQNNLIAVNTHRQLGIANGGLGESAEKLSSGFRINRAGDDAAGLAISEKMRAQIRGLTMASKNSQDAISMVQTAEGALQSTHNILQRMRELAVQAASDTNEQTIDRGALDKEFQQLKKEIDDTASKTRFNDQNLIDGTFQRNISTIGGATTLANHNALNVDRAVAGSYSMVASLVTGSAGSTTAGTPATGTVTNNNAAGDMLDAVVTFAGIDTTAHNGNTYTLRVLGEDVTSMTFQLMDSNGDIVSTASNINTTNFTTTDTSVNFSGVGALKIKLDAASTGIQATDAADRDAVQSLSGIKVAITGGTNPVVTEPKRAALALTIGGETLYLHKGDTMANFKDAGISFSFNALSDTSVTSTATFGTSPVTIEVLATSGKTMVIQTGANQGDALNINIDAMNTSKLGIKYASISSRESASQAITDVNDALNEVSTQRATLGALQNRLGHKIANLDTSAENLQAAESRIRDTDMAKEMTKFTKQNILIQAATAMLAQANQAPQNVLSLLR